MSRHLEMRAIEEIGIRANERFGTRLLPAKTAHVEDIAIPPEARAGHQLLVETFGIGPQYLWLSEYVAQSGIEQIELCIHIDDKAHRAVQSVKKKSSASRDARVDDAVGTLLLARFAMPIFDLSKTAMRAQAHAQNFDELMEMIWFCQEPTSVERPCGFCRPCR
jgi:hypothetical protein